MARRLLETPERVAVAYDVAGVGPRALAFLVDVGILFFLWILVVFVVPLVIHGDLMRWLDRLSSLLQALLVVAVFAVNFGYSLLFEWAWHGQTPGKRLLGLRVVRVDGQPYDLTTSAVRNLSRLVDGLPLNLYAVGLTSAVISRDHQRLGDLLAGTVLVKEGAVDLSLYDRPPEEAAAPGGGPSLGTGLGPAGAAVALSADAWEVVAETLRRLAGLTDEARGRVLEAALDAAAPALGPGEVDRLRDAPADAEAALRRLVEASGQQAGAGRGADALVRFVHVRRPAWRQLETLLDRLGDGRLPLADVADLDHLYRRASSDLAYAQTFFPATVPATYLNRLTARAYRQIYRGGGRQRAAVGAFFTRGFPGAVWASLPEVGLSAGLLVLGVAAGALLTWADPRVADAVLGSRLMHAVRGGKVWTDDVLAVAPPSLVGAKILTNNISVTIAAFVGGLTAGVATAGLLLLNGALLGVAFVATAQHGVASHLLGFILAHGPVELSVIVLAGAAGLLVARALVAPGALPRREALELLGRRAVRIVLGGAPWLVLVGLVEGFVSPGSFFPVWAKAALGLTLGAALWIYLVRFGRRAVAGGAEAPVSAR